MYTVAGTREDIQDSRRPACKLICRRLWFPQQAGLPETCLPCTSSAREMPTSSRAGRSPGGLPTAALGASPGPLTGPKCLRADRPPGDLDVGSNVFVHGWTLPTVLGTWRASRRLGCKQT